MKKTALLLAVLLLLSMMPMTVFALDDTDTTSTISATDIENTSVVSFSIDNANIYSGMDRAYKDGYTPTVKDGIATVVLPLIASGNIKENTITVTLGLGETVSSPFVYKNYQKTVQLNENAVNSGSTAVLSYLVSFDLPLSSDRINGAYPLTINVQAQDTSGDTIQQTFTSYVTIADGKNPNAEPSTESTVKPQSQPKIIVSGYSVNPFPVEAGTEFTATATLQNTSLKKNVQNMTVTISCDSSDFLLLNTSNVIYIDKLGKGETTNIEIRYATNLNTAAQAYNITLSIEYDNSDATTLSSTGTVPVAVIQPLRVEMATPMIKDQINAGDTMPLSFQVMNMGRSAVYNVRVELTAPGLIPIGTAFIGNMEAGTSSTAEMDVFVGTKDMSEGYEGDDKYGDTNGTITLTYEDEAGKEYTQESEFSTIINEPVITPSTDNNKEEPEKASQWWVSILIGAALIAALATFLIMRGKRKAEDHEEI